MNNHERPEDKKARISFAVMWVGLLAVIAYKNRGRMRYYNHAPVTFGWAVLTLVIMIAIPCIYVWWANRRDSK